MQKSVIFANKILFTYVHELMMLSRNSFFLFFFCILFCSSCQRVEKNYYPDGILESEIPYKNGKIDGVARWYYLSERVSLEINYKEGLKEGVMLRFSRSGKRESVENYKNDSLHGVSLKYNEEGILVSETLYENGKKNGETKQYFNDGTLFVTGFYKDDLYDGKWTYFDMDGFVVGEGNFVKGNGILIGYNERENITRKVYYENNIIVKEEIYSADGQNIEKTLLYQNGRITDIQLNEK